MTDDNYTLWLTDLRVGTIRDVFCHQGTWFGDLDLEVDAGAGDVQQRVVEFVQFCQDWNERAEEADASEFEVFGDVIGIGLWRITGNDDKWVIEDAPNFMGDRVRPRRPASRHLRNRTIERSGDAVLHMEART